MAIRKEAKGFGMPWFIAKGIGMSLLRGNFNPSADPASLCRLDLEEGSWCLRLLNDTSHLRASSAAGI